jgi:hypothetical protein
MGERKEFFVSCGCNSASRNISSPSASQFHAIVYIRYSPSTWQIPPDCVDSLSSTLFIIVHGMDLLTSLLFLPPSFPCHLSFPSLFEWVVYRHRMCRIPLVNYFLTHHHTIRLYPLSFLPVSRLNSIQLSSLSIFPACYRLHLKYLKLLQLLLLYCPRNTDLLSTVYAFVASEELLESTIIYPACMLCSIQFCQSISNRALGNFCDFVQSSPPSIQFSAVTLLYLGFVYKSQVTKLDIISSEIGGLVEVTLVSISQHFYVLSGSIDIFSPSFQLSCSCPYQWCCIVDSFVPVGGIP